MYKKKKVLVIIPARGGSKSIPRKNIKLLNGKPLISYAIRAAKGARYVDRVIVSTDDQEIANVAKRFKAEVPFLRPAHLATDASPMLPVLQHAVACLEGNDKFFPDIIVLIHLTSPFLTADDLDKGIKEMIDNKTNSCATISWVHHRPEFMLVKKNRVYAPFIKSKDRSMRRQDFTPLYRINGAFYMSTRSFLMGSKRAILDFDNISGVVMPQERSIDIDEPVDFTIAEAVAKELKRAHKM